MKIKVKRKTPNAIFGHWNKKPNDCVREFLKETGVASLAHVISVNHWQFDCCHNYEMETYLSNSGNLHIT